MQSSPSEDLDTNARAFVGDDDDPPHARQLRDELITVVSRTTSNARVLEAMRSIPRHLFTTLPHDLEHAYKDYPQSIGFGATISQPTVVGIMSEALELTGTERVLEIGTGSGYQAAVLCRLAGHVDTIEVVPELAERASRILSFVGCSNVRVHNGDGWAGFPEGAPYDRIVVTAAPDVLPTKLLDQLGEEGLLVVPVGSQARDQRLERWAKLRGQLLKQDLGAVRFVPMVHANEAQ